MRLPHRRLSRVLFSSLIFLAACTSSPPPAPPAPKTLALPLAVGGGQGSSKGNYAALPAGEYRGKRGEHCVLFQWDRPLTADLAIRYQSASCEAEDNPGWMKCHEVGTEIIPIAQSNLLHEDE